MRWKQSDVPRETFIALRARRQAYRIAADCLYGRAMDVSAIDCPACHCSIHPAQEGSIVVRCDACGQYVASPSAQWLTPRTQLTAREVRKAAEDERMTAYAEEKGAREKRMILGFWMFAVAATLVALLFGICISTPFR